MTEHCCAWTFSSCDEQKLFSSCGVWVSHYNGPSCNRAQALGVWALVAAGPELRACSLRALECRPSHCGTRAELLCCVWNLPRPGIKPVSPALVGGLLSTGPLGKCPCLTFQGSREEEDPSVSCPLGVHRPAPPSPPSCLRQGCRPHYDRYCFSLDDIAEQGHSITFICLYICFLH